MSKALSLFYTFVAPHVHGCPEPMLDQALRHAAIEFCRRTNAHQTVEMQATHADEPDYDIDVPNGTRLTMILGVWHGAAKLDPVATDEVGNATALRGDVGDETASEGTPRAYYQKVPSTPTISLWPVPDTTATDKLTIRAAFEPTLAATTLADLLYDYHAHDIAAGAIAYLMNLPGQVFSDPKLGSLYAGRFAVALGRAGPIARAGDSRRSMSVAHRPFA